MRNVINLEEGNRGRDGESAKKLIALPRFVPFLFSLSVCLLFVDMFTERIPSLLCFHSLTLSQVLSSFYAVGKRDLEAKGEGTFFGVE